MENELSKFLIVKFFKSQQKDRKPVSFPTLLKYLENNNISVSDEETLNDIYQSIKQEYKNNPKQTFLKYYKPPIIEETPQTGWQKPMIRNEEGKLRIGDTIQSDADSKIPFTPKVEEVIESPKPSQMTDEQDIEQSLQNMTLEQPKIEENPVEMADEKDIEQLLQNMTLETKVEEPPQTDFQKPARKVDLKKGKQLTKMQQLHKEVEKEKKELENRKQAFLNPEQIKNKKKIMGMTNEIKAALPYYALLSYYLADKTIPLSDPFLTNFFSDFYKVEEEFKDKFIALNPTARINFINDYFQNKRLSDIYESLLNNTLVNKESIQDTIDKYLPISNVIDVLQDELNANTMYYVLSISIDEDEFKNKDELSKSLVDQISQVLIQRMKDRNYEVSEEEVKKHINISIENVNSETELINHIHQAQTLLTQNVDEDKVQDIQDLYTDSYPEVINRILKGSDDEGPSGKENLFKYVPIEAHSDLNMLSSYFQDEENRKKIIEIAKKITKDKPAGETNVTKYQIDAVKQLSEAGNIDEIDKHFLLTFIKYYGNLRSIPHKPDDHMLSLNSIDNYPRYIQTIFHKNIRKLTYHVGQDIKKFLDKVSEEDEKVKDIQNSLLSKLQYEILKEKPDKSIIVQLINELNLDADHKSRFLTLVNHGEFDNIYMLLKTSQIKTRSLINPLIYSGIRREARLRKLRESESMLGSISVNLPNVSSVLKECIKNHMLAPWKLIDSKTVTDNKSVHVITQSNLGPYNFVPRDKGFSYFITNPDYPKEEVSDEQRLCLGSQLPFKEYSNVATPLNGKWAKYNDKAVYVPTNHFWKVYCSGRKEWDDDHIVLSYNRKGEDFELPFTIGIMYRVSQSSTQFVMEYLTKADFERETKWVKEHSVITSSFYDFCKLRLYQHKMIREFARNEGLTQITNILKKFFKVNNLELSYKARKLEDAIYEHREHVTLHDYFKILYTTLYFLDPESGIDQYIDYYHNLFINTSPGIYKTIVFDQIEKYIPELYLVNDISKRNDFVHSLEFVIDNSIRRSSQLIYRMSNISKTRDPLLGHIDTPFFSTGIIDNITRRLRGVLSGIHAHNLRNVCVNRDMVKDNPDFVISSGKDLYCFTDDQMQKIVDNDFKEDIPSSVINEIKQTYGKQHFNFIERLLFMRDTANEYISNNLKQIITLWNIQFVNEKENDLGFVISKPPFTSLSEMNTQQRKVIDDIAELNLIFPELELTESDKELLLQHMLQQIPQTYFDEINYYIDVYMDLNPSIISTLQSSESIEHKEQVINTLLNYINDQITLSKPVRKAIRQFLLHKYKVEEEKPITEEYKCFNCSKTVDNPLWKTYHTTNMTVYCSRGCFAKFDDHKLRDDDSQSLKVDLVKSLLAPYMPPRERGSSTPDDIMSVAESYGMKKIPQIVIYEEDAIRDGVELKVQKKTYDQDKYDNLYGNILRQPNFVPSKKILEERIVILKTLASKFDVSDNKEVEQIFKDLHKNKEFTSIYNTIANSYILSKINTTLERLVFELIEKRSPEALLELAKQFNIDASKFELKHMVGPHGFIENATTEHIVSQLEHIPEIVQIANKYKKNKLVKYGLGIVDHKDTISVFAKLKANQLVDRIDQIDFRSDIFEPFMKENKINYQNISQFLQNYKQYSNDVLILDSLGKAMKHVRKVNMNWDMLHDLTNASYKDMKPDEVDEITESKVHDVVKRMGIEEDIYKLGVEFVYSSFDRLSDFLFRKHHFVSQQLQKVYDLITLLRKVSNEFIQQIISSQPVEKTIEQREALFKLQPKPMEAPRRPTLADRLMKQHVLIRRPAQKPQTVVPQVQQQSLDVTLKEKSEQALRYMFSPVYKPETKKHLGEKTDIRIITIPDTFRDYFNRQIKKIGDKALLGEIEEVPKGNVKTYVIRLKFDDKLIPLHRTDFEIIEEDTIADEDIEEAIMNELGEPIQVEEEAETFINENEEALGEEVEGQDYGEDYGDEDKETY
jgi:hypothetical protein